MKAITKTAVTAGLAIAAVAGGLVVGNFVGATAVTTAPLWEAPSVDPADAYSGKDDFGVNANGQTFGTVAQASSVENEPDLILAYGQNDKGESILGYVLRLDMTGPMTVTPEELGLLQAEQGDGDRLIPLYESDGKTVIGTFLLTGGAASGG